MDFSTLFYGLVSALFWGAADFSGGAATRRGDVIQVVLISQVIGGLALVVLALAWGEPLPAGRDFLFGAAAGLFGAIGLVALYRGLAGGLMGVFAPATAVVASVIPLAAAMALEGLPTARQSAGLLFGVAAIWSLSFGKHEGGNGIAIRPAELVRAGFAGLGFGLFFVLIDQVGDGAVFWPLAAARLASVTLMAGIAFGRHFSGRALWSWPSNAQSLIVIAAGVLDAGGNIFFVLAAQSGRLDVATVLASLYPGATLFLAVLFFNERLTPRQWVGAFAALLAVALIAG